MTTCLVNRNYRALGQVAQWVACDTQRAPWTVTAMYCCLWFSKTLNYCVACDSSEKFVVLFDFQVLLFGMTVTPDFPLTPWINPLKTPTWPSSVADAMINANCCHFYLKGCVVAVSILLYCTLLSFQLHLVLASSLMSHLFQMAFPSCYCSCGTVERHFWYGASKYVPLCSLAQSIHLPWLASFHSNNCIFAVFSL